jgi:hypothetical protein
MTYLGADVANDAGRSHTQNRIKAAQRAFFSLQGAGVHFKGVDPNVAMDIFSTGVQSVLTYGCESIYMSKARLQDLDRCQSKLIKSILGLRKTSHSTPILQAVNIKPVSQCIGLKSLNLLKSCFLYKSSATKFYSHLLCNDTKYTDRTLVGRAQCFSKGHDINLMKYVLDECYKVTTTKTLKGSILTGQDGLVDSARVLLNNYSVDGARDILQLLVASF